MCLNNAVYEYKLLKKYIYTGTTSQFLCQQFVSQAMKKAFIL